MFAGARWEGSGGGSEGCHIVGCSHTTLPEIDSSGRIVGHSIHWQYNSLIATIIQVTFTMQDSCCNRFTLQYKQQVDIAV